MEARHETLGNGFNGFVALEPLDATKAAAPASYDISSGDDANYKTPQHPQSVGRKSKGREFVKEGGKFPWVPEHWVFLRLPRPMQNGKSDLSLIMWSSLATACIRLTPAKWRLPKPSL